MTVNNRNSKTVATLLTLTFCIACSRGGGSGGGGVALPDPDTFGPTASVRFPGANSVTDRDTISVTGTAFDPSGIAVLSVNGVSATTDTRFDSWVATIPLTPGENTLAISTTDALGNVTEIAAAGLVKYVGPFLADAREIHLKETDSEALIVDSDLDALIGVDLATGHRRTISAEGIGEGPSFKNPVAIATLIQGQRVLVLDRGTSSIMSVDLITGDRLPLFLDSGINGASFQFGQSLLVDQVSQNAFVTFVTPLGQVGIFEFFFGAGAGVAFSTNTIGGGPDLVKPTGIDLASSLNQLFLVDEAVGALYSVDLTTGFRTTVTSAFLGEGPVLIEPHSPQWDETENAVYLIDPGLGALIKVDVSTGDRSVVSDATHGEGPALDRAVSVELDSALSRALVAVEDGVLEVDLITGDRSLFSGSDLGFGPSLVAPSNAFGHLRAGTIVVQSNDPEALPPGFTLSRVNVNSGNRDVAATSDSGSGVDVLRQFSFECTRTLSHAVAVGSVLIDSEPKLAVYTINLSNSNRVLNYVFQDAPTVLTAVDVELDGSNSMVFVGFEDQIWRVSLKSGIAELLSGLGVGLGEPLLEVQRMVLDLAGDRLLVTDRGRGSVIRVRLTTGSRSEVTGTKIGMGPLSGGMLGIDIDARNRRIAFTDESSKSVYLADIHTGERTLLFDGEDASSLFPNDTPTDIVLDVKRNVAYVTFRGALDAIVKIELSTLDRVLISR